MKYGSVCSGIEGATVAWHPLGFKPLFFSEIEKFPRDLLKYHYPDVPLYGDFTELRHKPEIICDCDILVGGCPCQAFSVAGLRKSLDDERGNLTLEFVRLADAIDNVRHSTGRKPSIILFENVPGILSTKDNAFGCFLAGLVGDSASLIPPRRKWANAGLVIGQKRTVAWRTLDAQFFGVPQRRRRVFVIASARKDISIPEILFESDSVRRDFAPCRGEGEEIAGTLTKDAFSGGAGGKPDGAAGNHFITCETAKCLTSRGAGCGNSDLETSNVVIALAGNTIDRQPQNGGNGKGYNDTGSCYTLTKTDRHAVATSLGVRRLLPEECESLQGFPRGYTKIKKKTGDGARYKALGNSFAVPVVRWVGERIKQTERNII